MTLTYIVRADGTKNNAVIIAGKTVPLKGGDLRAGDTVYTKDGPWYIDKNGKSQKGAAPGNASQAGNYKPYSDLTAAERASINTQIYDNKTSDLWPLANWTENYNNWPNYNDYNGGASHGGVDIAAPKGTEIYSIYYGTATAVAGTDAGNYVQVVSTINGKTVTISYMHTSDWAYPKGTTWEVKPGDLIGYVGGTGSANGRNHLHFQVNFNGRPGDNPFEYLPQEPKK